MFTPTRDEARQFFFDTWARHRRGEALEGLQRTALAIVLMHPEYEPWLDHPERYLRRDFPPEAGDPNPFLHLALHLAVAEQLSIDQPPGIARRYRRLLQRTSSEHDALHALLECLAETIWQAQRSAEPPDMQVYLGCLDRRVEE